jgi:hypothetical protein
VNVNVSHNSASVHHLRSGVCQTSEWVHGDGGVRSCLIISVRVIGDQISIKHYHILTTIHWSPIHILVGIFDDSMRIGANEILTGQIAFLANIHGW